MSDENTDEKPPSSSHPYFVSSGFPFVFLPTTFTTGFTFANDQTHDSTTESRTKEENDENSEEETKTIDHDEANLNHENEESSDEKNDLRISQPKYSQLLKELDFSHTRMVDVTNLLTNELDQQGNYLTPDENENPQKNISDDKYQSLSSTSSSVSNDELTNENKQLKNAAQNIEDDLNNLAAIIQASSQLPTNKNEEEIYDNDDLFPMNIPKKPTFDEDDDNTSKQATQNYDLQENEQEDLMATSKSSKIHRLISQNSNSIQNENKTSMSHTDTETQTQAKKQEDNDDNDQQIQITWETLMNVENPFVERTNDLKFSQINLESHTTPKRFQQSSTSSDEKSKTEKNSLKKPKIRLPPRQINQFSSSSSSTSSTESVVEYVLPRMDKKQLTPPIVPPQTLRQDSQATLIDENLDDLNSQLKHVLDQERQTLSTKEERTTDGIGSVSFPLSTDIVDDDVSNQIKNDLYRNLINQRSTSQRKKTNHQHYQKYSESRRTERKSDENWLTMLDTLENEHRTRLEKQQQKYQDSMHNTEAKLKRHFDDYLTLTNGFQESRLANHDEPLHSHRTYKSVPIDSNIGKYKIHSYKHQYRPIAQDLISRYYPPDSTLNMLKRETRRPFVTTNDLSQSREDILNLRTELSVKHAKHIADLKLYYEYEINDLKSQLNRARMGNNTSSSTRQSIETIERINNENIRLHDEVKELLHAKKMAEDENILLKRQLEELREQLNNRDIELKNFHRTIVDLEQQLSQAENTKERQDEKFRHADRQALFYREENEKLKTDMNLTRERLVRIEERHREQELENETLRRQIFMLENDNNRIKPRITNEHKFDSTMSLNVPISKDYGRFTVDTRKFSVSSLNSPRNEKNDLGKLQTNENEKFVHHSNSPRVITRINDYLNERPVYPERYVAPTRNVYSPRKPSPNRTRVVPVSTKNSIDRQFKQNEQLEQKFDHLLRKKRDLETRLNRIPLHNLTNTDRQLYDLLDREIERVEQQISSVKLELRKINVFRKN